MISEERLHRALDMLEKSSLEVVEIHGGTADAHAFRSGVMSAIDILRKEFPHELA